MTDNYLDCRGGSQLGRLLGCGHNSQIVNIHELPVQLVVGRDGPRVGVDGEHVLRPGVDQSDHAVGEVLALGVSGLDGGDGVLLASLLPHIDVVVRPFEEGRVGCQSSPHPGERTAPGVSVVLEEVVRHLPHLALSAGEREADLQLARDVTAGLVDPRPDDVTGGEEV